MIQSSLLNVLPLPLNPIETGDSSQWDGVERELGTALPRDYKAFINTYGTGAIGRFLWIANPFSENPHLNLFTRVEFERERWNSLKAHAPDYLHEYYPCPMFPDVGGLLAFGSTDNGDAVCWKTVGSSDEWTIFVRDARAPLYDEYDLRLTDYLLKLLRDEIQGEMIVADMLDRSQLFSAHPRYD